MKSSILITLVLTAGLAWSATSSDESDYSSASANSNPPGAAEGGHAGGGGGSHSSGGSRGSPSSVSSRPAGGPSSSFSRSGAQGSYGRQAPGRVPGRPIIAPGHRPQRPAGVQPKVPSRSGVDVRRSGNTAQPRVSHKTGVLHGREATPGNTIRTRDGRPHEGNWARNNPTNQSRFDRQTQDHLRNWKGPKSDYLEACRRHGDHHRRHHDHNWWHRHCPTVVLVDWGFWGWYDGWWYPAWGYDTNYSYYEYDGPIYGFDGLLPDEVVANVQSALQDLGYYPYEVDGIFGPLTQEALTNFQRDQRLTVTGVIDPATVVALGLTN